jgi:ribosomal protein L24E
VGLCMLCGILNDGRGLVYVVWDIKRWAWAYVCFVGYLKMGVGLCMFCGIFNDGRGLVYLRGDDER